MSIEPSVPPGRAAALDPRAGALDRGLAILMHLARRRSARVADIAEALGLSKSTTYRLVERLQQQDWLVQETHGGEVRLGPAAAQLAAAATSSTSLRDAADPVLRELLTATQETVSLAVPNGLTMVFVNRMKGPHPVGVSAELGVTRPLHCTSVGRAYLAALPSDQCERVLDELAASHESPVTAADLPGLRHVLETTRERGWSEDRREFNISSSCAGAAIRDHTGQPIAAFSVAGVAERMDPELDAVGPLVRKAAGTVSARLGYLPPEE
ncbi:IclR family transcriptional regulator [Streptomyces sp. NPDC096311]|uniref:IclR family transcriptional regulator n=1 Tax=Streptomyces sp. NPDC096311 TaxID=3366083 RepID=UPI0038099820